MVVFVLVCDGGGAEVRVIVVGEKCRDENGGGGR